MHHSTEWDTDLLIKKPWTLSDKAEIMLGVGPDWIHTATHNQLAGEAAVDVMFWPKNHRIGWYLEPSYTFAPLPSRSISFTAGLLIGLGHPK